MWIRVPSRIQTQEHSVMLSKGVRALDDTVAVALNFCTKICSLNGIQRVYKYA
jgi:hypothetical protein